VNWHEVAKRVPGRDNKDCRKRYYNEHDGAVKKGTWSKSEDVRLEGLVREHGTQWAVVARRMETRSADRTSPLISCHLPLRDDCHVRIRQMAGAADWANQNARNDGTTR
jgi:hypothetical protein